MTRCAYVANSDNNKTGPIAQVYTEQATCWRGCPFYSICYAFTSWRVVRLWRRLTAGLWGGSFKATCKRIAALPFAAVWRWGIAGDLPGKGARIARVPLRAITRANKRKRGFAYSHKPVLDGQPHAKANREAIAEANAGGFTVNLSGEGLTRADALADLGIAPVVTAVPSTWGKQWKTARTPKGRPVVQCPAEWTKSMGAARVQCIGCGGAKGPLCQRRDRAFIVGLTAWDATRKINAAIAKVEQEYAT